MAQHVRVRFAPSPTGALHIGGVRTALYNYLFARKNNGVFIVRIEDTDQTRYVASAERYILESLAWAGITPDEGVDEGGDYGPYRQSERKEIYAKYAQQLIDSGNAYYAFDTTEELEEMRQRLIDSGSDSRQYDIVTRSSMKNSLTLSEDEVQQRLNSDEPRVIRIKVPEGEKILINDMIRGKVEIDSSQIDDKVVFKADGMPTYHLANVIDDHLMEITHVIRGEEWLPSTPIHILLYRGFGWENEMPAFVHLPLILKPDGNGKLSKRDGERLGFPVYPLTWTEPESNKSSTGFKDQGFFPEAFVNFLALLGWNPGTEQEIFSMDELVETFSIERINKAGAKFDYEKAKWFNQQHLKNYADNQLMELAAPMLREQFGSDLTDEYIEKVCGVMKERITFIEDLPATTDYFFVAPESYDEKVVNKKWNDRTNEFFHSLLPILNDENDFSSAHLEELIKGHGESMEIKPGEFLPVLRMILTGGSSGPSNFDVAEILGKEEVLNRISTAIAKLSNTNVGQ